MRFSRVINVDFFLKKFKCQLYMKIFFFLLKGTKFISLKLLFYIREGPPHRTLINYDTRILQPPGIINFW